MVVKITIDNNTVVRILAVAVGFLLMLQFFAAVRQALTLMFIAAFLALALNAPVSAIASRITRGRRGVATGLAYILVLTIIGLFTWTIIPPLLSQTGQFLDNVPAYIDDLTSGDGKVAELVQEYELDSELNELGENLRSRLGDSSDTIFSGINRIGTAIVSLLTVLVLAFLMLVEGPDWLDRLWALQSEPGRSRRQLLAGKMYNVITSYVNGQLFIALLASASSLIAMIIVGIPFALSLAGVVGVFGLIPLVGATLGSVVVIIVALFQSFYAAVIMAIFFLVYQQIENNVIQPFVQSRTLEVSPLLVLSAVIVGISVGGVLGGFVAIPIAACIRILVNDFLQRKSKKESASRKFSLKKAKD